MAYDFKILDAFLEQHASEVEGRGANEPPEEFREKMRAFARGTLNDTDREELIRILTENPGWVAILAKEALDLRPKRPKEDGAD